MDKKKLNKTEIEEHFKQSDSVSVVFTKKDGSERTLVCTQNLDLMPKEKRPTGKGKDRAKPVNTVVVFDLEKNDWRSFNVDSVISVTPVGG